MEDLREFERMERETEDSFYHGCFVSDKKSFANEPQRVLLRDSMLLEHDCSYS